MNPYGIDLMSYNGQIINNYSSLMKPGDPNAKSVHVAVSNGRSKTAFPITSRR